MNPRRLQRETSLSMIFESVISDQLRKERGRIVLNIRLATPFPLTLFR